MVAIGDKVFVVPLYGQKDNLAIISKTAENGNGEEEEMFVDISPTSAYYVTRGGNITFGTYLCCYADVYCIKATSTGVGITLTEYVEVDLTSLMADMTNPVIIAYFGLYAQFLRYDGEKGRAQMWIRDENDNVIAKSCMCYANIETGHMSNVEMTPAVTADLTSYKTLKTKLGMQVFAKASGGHTVYATNRMLGYIGLYDAKK